MPRVWLITAVLVAPALAPANAAAGDQLPVPAIAQYVESIPTSGGPAVPAAAPTPRVRKLPATVQQKVLVQGGTDAPTIEAIATSSAYGAPQTTLERPAAAKPKAVAQRPPSSTPHPAVRVPRLSAPTFSTDGGGEDRLPILGGLMLAATAAMVVASRRMRG